ncbi:hypothetical protein BC943DRAFT_334100 [Umbelopsis sp. AD052]|nr:hypothetical protein BC943DRAFT_334100 [Umbelopsis sp. AD052]
MTLTGDSEPRIIVVAAISGPSRGIGLNNDLPWPSTPAELAWSYMAISACEGNAFTTATQCCNIKTKNFFLFTTMMGRPAYHSPLILKKHCLMLRGTILVYLYWEGP